MKKTTIYTLLCTTILTSGISLATEKDHKGAGIGTPQRVSQLQQGQILLTPISQLEKQKAEIHTPSIDQLKVKYDIGVYSPDGATYEAEREQSNLHLKNEKRRKKLELKAQTISFQREMEKLELEEEAKRAKALEERTQELKAESEESSKQLESLIQSARLEQEKAEQQLILILSQLESLKIETATAKEETESVKIEVAAKEKVIDQLKEETESVKIEVAAKEKVIDQLKEKTESKEKVIGELKEKVSKTRKDAQSDRQVRDEKIKSLQQEAKAHFEAVNKYKLEVARLQKQKETQDQVMSLKAPIEETSPLLSLGINRNQTSKGVLSGLSSGSSQKLELKQSTTEPIGGHQGLETSGGNSFTTASISSESEKLDLKQPITEPISGNQDLGTSVDNSSAGTEKKKGGVKKPANKIF